MNAPLMTIDEASARLCVSPRTVSNLIKRGALRHVQIGRVIRIEPIDLQQFIEDRAVKVDSVSRAHLQPLRRAV